MNFIKCAIICGKIWDDRIYKYGISSENHQYLPVIRKNIDQNRVSAPYWRSIARGKHIFTTCMEEYNGNIYAEFKRYTGLSIDEYYLCSLMILSQYADVTIEKVSSDSSKCGLFCMNTMLDNATDDSKQIMNKYITNEGQTPEMLRSSLINDPNSIDPHAEMDMSFLINKPLVISSGSTRMGVVLDLVSYNKKVALAPHIILQNAYSDSPAKIERLKKDLGHAFEEKYVSSILSSMFADEKQGRVIPSPVVYRSAAEEGIDEHQLCDFAIVRGQDLAIIEANAILLSEDKVQLDNPSSYKREILNKYGRTSEKKAKGAGQLVRAIQKLVDRGWKSDQFDIRNVRHVYPILLFYDDLISTFGHVELLCSKFINSLEPDYHYQGTSHVQKRRLVSTPLILLSINELEDLHGTIGHFDFFDFLNDYARYLHGRSDSISSFIQSQPKDSKYKFYYNLPMMDRIVDELNEAGRLFFNVKPERRDKKP